MSKQHVMEILRGAAKEMQPEGSYDALIEQIGDASVVLLGEATHGTHEFYRARAEITKRLILEKDFDAVAVEADWPDALRVSRYAQIRARDGDRNAEEALRGFQRFPLWMWRNSESVEFIEWLRSYNLPLPEEARIGFYGLDLYSLRTSMDAVIRYLAQVDPEAARQAKARYSCFDHLAEDPQRYGYATTFGMRKDCEEEVLRQLVALKTKGERYIESGEPGAADELFYAQQNARVAQNAEAYYRAMFRGRDESWNLRDTHMADTLDALLDHLGKSRSKQARIVVWAHNSHIGDARATEMGDHGQLNLGQLVRERHGPAEAYLLGFTTHAGTVAAASEWDSPPELKQVRASRSDSYERLFHNLGLGNFFLPIRGQKPVSAALSERRLERAIGVLYLPESERLSHYFHANLAQQFDAIIHFDETRALQPLDKVGEWEHEGMPETFPSGM